ncbi:RNA polymerase sigma factor [Duganella callida]|nr:sigma-70 family RNA polymerase sigma factor [Duganella callida]
MEKITRQREHLAQLLESVAQHSEPAFNELYQLTHAYLHYVVLNVLGNRAHADETLQEIYVAVWAQAHRFDRTRGCAMTWLISVARNQARSAWRTGRRERDCVLPGQDVVTLEALAHGEQTQEGDPVQDAFYASVRSRLPAAMAQLVPAQRQAIMLTYGHGLAHAELAQHMNAPLGTVKSWLRRGLARLGDCLQPAAAP